MNIVFVCTSNTCRSPISELFTVDWFKRRLKLSREEQEAKGIIVRSGAYVTRWVACSGLNWSADRCACLDTATDDSPV
jgi:hypothetical protein